MAEDFSYYDADSISDDADSLFPTRAASADGFFALEAQGDSLAEAGIHDGDIVILKPATVVRDHDLVAVRLKGDEEILVKYYYREEGRVRLQSANASVEPIYIDNPNHVHVVGKVVMVIRKAGGI